MSDKSCRICRVMCNHDAYMARDYYPEFEGKWECTTCHELINNNIYPYSNHEHSMLIGTYIRLAREAKEKV